MNDLADAGERPLWPSALQLTPPPAASEHDLADQIAANAERVDGALEHHAAAPRRYLETLDAWHESPDGPRRTVCGLLRGMLSRSAMAAWFRRRAAKLRQACGERRMDHGASEDEMTRFDLRPGYRGFLREVGDPWHVLRARLTEDDLLQLRDQLQRLQDEAPETEEP